jgi:hypothetical protein
MQEVDRGSDVDAGREVPAAELHRRHQLAGNGGEWTATKFEPFPGFERFPFYPGYSANVFDGSHYVMKGGSARTAAPLLRRSFRNWFRPDYPFVYAVQVNAWTFTDKQATRLREYLLKGGFLMVDDFHGTSDWDSFLRGMRMVLPADQYPITDLADNDEIFHVLYDIGQRFQVPGEQYVSTGRTYEKDGYVAKWRGIRNEHGRIMVAWCRCGGRRRRC